MALRWAMDIARRRGLRDIVFLSDCTTAVGSRHSDQSLNWSVEYISRSLNRVADKLAGKARRRAAA